MYILPQWKNSESISHRKFLGWEKVCIWLEVETPRHLFCTLMLSDLEVKSCHVITLPGMEMTSCQRSGKSSGESSVGVFWRVRAALKPGEQDIRWARGLHSFHFGVNPNLTRVSDSSSLPVLIWKMGVEFTTTSEGYVQACSVMSNSLRPHGL